MSKSQRLQRLVTVGNSLIVTSSLTENIGTQWLVQNLKRRAALMSTFKFTGFYFTFVNVRFLAKKREGHVNPTVVVQLVN